MTILTKEITTEIIDAIKRTGFSESLIVQSDPLVYMNITVELMRVLVNELGYSGLIIMASKDAYSMYLKLKSLEVDTDKLYFIDTVSVISGLGTPPIRNCTTITHPYDYSDIMMYMNLFIKKIKKPKFILMLDISVMFKFDSIDNVVAEFLLPVIDRFKLLDSKNIVQISDSDDSIFRNFLERQLDHKLVL